ncbi:DUF551 domain-containing protein [Pantoea septica]|uniref:DUF551 domain-containing protein n=1 Tax=Pantoea septica TaxID=472695 RepID=UPI003D008955
MISDLRLHELASPSVISNVSRAEAEAMAKELLAHRKAEPAAPDGWIKCKDRLPAGEEFVLACWSHTGHVEDVFFAFDEDEPEQRYHVLYDGERMLQGPTHWKPLELPQDN